MKGVISSGGIGDLIMSLPLLEKLEEHLGPFQIYTDHPEVLSFYTGKTSQKIQVLYDTHKLIDYSSKKWQWQYLIHLTNFSWFVWSSPKGDHLSLYQKNRDFIEAHQMMTWIHHHPHLDGEASSIMKEKGYNRITLAQHMMGYPHLPLVQLGVKPLSFWNKNYITLHCGVGENHAGMVERPTKMWDISYYEQLVFFIKRKFPKLKIVQLGSSLTSKKIKGVDTCFLGLNIEDSFRILAGSRLHVDGESGLVHAATSFGVKCVVLFGPTPVGYFSYPQNVNLSVQLACSGCWWSTDDWVSKCPAHNKTPICMDLIFPSRVLEEIEKCL